MRHGGGGGGGHEGGEMPVTTGTPHVGMGLTFLVLGLSGGLVYMVRKTPRTFRKVLVCAAIGTVLMLLGHVSTIIGSTPVTIGVLIVGWWLSGEMEAETAARKTRASTQEGQRK